MRNEKTESARRPRHHGILIVLVLLVGFAIGIFKDLDNLRNVGNFVQALSMPLLDVGMNTAQASSKSRFAAPVTQSTDEFHWSGKLAPGQTLEIKGVNGDIIAQAGNSAEVTAIKVGQKSDPSLVTIKVIENPNGVTICALYPSDDPGSPNTCEAGDGNGRMNVRNNDVKVTFKVQVPAGVNTALKTVNGEITAQSLSGNVDSRTVNGSINIATSGYAQAKTVNGEISAKVGSATWPEALEFKTVNGEITVELPSTVNARVEASTMSGDISSDFQLATVEKLSKKHLSGTIGSGGRDLNMKTVNGGIRLRRAG